MPRIRIRVIYIVRMDVACEEVVENARAVDARRGRDVRGKKVDKGSRVPA